ncbi:MAG: hypothetical protein HOP02_00845 [Methylococcaceae bacterium]|nr:hypothetical protein [Methylococcaceae bacterium]
MTTPEPYVLAGRSAATNAATAVSATAGMNAAQKMVWFYNQVRADGDMDYKSIKTYPDYAGSQASQDFGNFNYGVVGDALGIPPWLLDVAAGWQQIKTDHENAWKHQAISGSLNPFDHNWGDDPADQQKINQGIKWSQDNGLTNATTIPEQVVKDFLKEFFLPYILISPENIQNAIKESRYFCDSLFWASQPKQAAKDYATVILLRKPRYPWHNIVPTQQGDRDIVPIVDAAYR